MPVTGLMLISLISGVAMFRIAKYRVFYPGLLVRNRLVGVLLLLPTSAAAVWSLYILYLLGRGY